MVIVVVTGVGNHSDRLSFFQLAITFHSRRHLYDLRK